MSKTKESSEEISDSTLIIAAIIVVIIIIAAFVGGSWLLYNFVLSPEEYKPTILEDGDFWIEVNLSDVIYEGAITDSIGTTATSDNYIELIIAQFTFENWSVERLGFLTGYPYYPEGAPLWNVTGFVHWDWKYISHIAFENITVEDHSSKYLTVWTETYPNMPASMNRTAEEKGTIFVQAGVILA